MVFSYIRLGKEVQCFMRRGIFLFPSNSNRTGGGLQLIDNDGISSTVSTAKVKTWFKPNGKTLKMLLFGFR